MAAPHRIAVLGCSGSGKSTLAAALAVRLGLPLVATDAAFWTADWAPRPHAEVRAWLAEQIAADAWVTDGNFEVDRDLLWAGAQLAVWLDYPLAIPLWRVARRNVGWWLSRKPVWGGLRMTLPKALTGVRHTLRSHAQKHRDYPALLAAIPTLDVVRLRTPAEAERWLETL